MEGFSGKIPNKVEQKMNNTLVKVKNLKKHFHLRAGLFSRAVGAVKAVDGVSFEIYPNETFGLVGESGCGKSTLGRVLLRLIEPTEGEIYFMGKDLRALKGEELRRMRKEMQIIFQDPYSSLNPRMTVGSIIGEAFTIHRLARGKEKRERVMALLDEVGVRAEAYNRYPHEFSGGQRQRIGIARALACEPKFIVCDEPVSALDVSIQAQILNLFLELQDKYKISYLFISHDLRVVEHIADRVAVMYLGKIVEMAKAQDLYKNPLHPYTQIILASVPLPDPKLKKKRAIITGDVPSPINPPPGCLFHPRCKYARDICQKQEPEIKEYEPGHFASCHFIPLEKI
jgi:oligopeptide transport system ATP-binding protein